jgi:hypothetical protein
MYIVFVVDSEFLPGKMEMRSGYSSNQVSSNWQAHKEEMSKGKTARKKTPLSAKNLMVRGVCEHPCLAQR